jgi:two-component system, OmpR family, sensor histidine kinase MprB
VSLRRRLVLLSALAVAAGVVVAIAAAYIAVRSQFRGEVDNQLKAQEQLIARAAPPPALLAPPRGLPQLPARRGGPAAYIQIVAADGTVHASRSGTSRLPVTRRVRAVAAGRAPTELVDVELKGNHLRMVVARLPGGGAVQIARSLDSIDRVLGRLRLILLLILVAGVALAALLARLVARRVLAPIGDLTAAAEHIEATHDLGRRITAPGGDEVGRLARGFNAMLDELQRSHAALDASVTAQRRLVADASHELRTPITSLHTNIELLGHAERMSEADRRAVLESLADQSEELAALVTDVIELARGDEPLHEDDEVRLDAVVAEAIERAHRHAPDVHFTADLEATTIAGSPGRLGRAVNNLLDNAARHSAPAGVIEVTLRDTTLTVRDHGPGIAATDLPHVFDRFYRGERARGQDGAGLGLAIVRQTIEQHGGRVRAANATDGGAVFTVELPSLQPLEHHASPQATSRV